jgi:hypothetical protein
LNPGNGGSGSSSKLSTGAIAGIAAGVGVSALAGLVFFLTWCLRRNRNPKPDPYSGLDNYVGTAETTPTPGTYGAVAGAGTGGAGGRPISTMTALTDSSLPSSLQKSPNPNHAILAGAAGYDQQGLHPGPHPQYPFVANGQHQMLHPMQQQGVQQGYAPNQTPSPVSNPSVSLTGQWGQGGVIHEAPSDDGQGGYSPPPHGFVEAPAGNMNNGYGQQYGQVHEVQGEGMHHAGTTLGTIQELGPGHGRDF